MRTNNFQPTPREVLARSFLAETAASLDLRGVDLEIVEVHDFVATAVSDSPTRGRVTLSRHVVEYLSLDEVRTIIAHEVGHLYLRHGLRTTLLAIILVPSGVCLLLFLTRSLSRPRRVASLVAGGSLLGALLAVASLAVGRHEELEADRFAVGLLGREVVTRGLLHALADDEADGPLPLGGILASHPSRSQRLASLDAAGAEPLSTKERRPIFFSLGEKQ